ncbi:MAG: MazG family protein [Acidimicrobiales bacterium]
MITVVGLGPAGPEHLTTLALELIDSADIVYLRTERHPSAAEVLDRRDQVRCFDGEYEKSESFEAVYQSVVTELLDAAAGGAEVCYGVPGSPAVAERTVELLREQAPGRGIALRVTPAVSYLDLAWDRLGIDPLAVGVRLVDAESFEVAAADNFGPLLVSQAWSSSLLSSLKLSLEEPPPGQSAVVLHHLGLPDEHVVQVAWADLDRAVEPDHLTSVFIPGLVTPPGAAMSALVETVATLRQRCPWDREQTHRSLLRHLLEETYEAMEALEALGDDPANASPDAAAHAEEELGDLLCQVVLHSRLGTEEGLFTLSDVARSIDKKLTSRHPHVFGDTHAETADDVVRNWELAKHRSKQRTHLLEGIPAAMPALARAEKTERKLASVGLGWTQSGETPHQLAARLEQLGQLDQEGGEEAGTLLLLVARLLAHLRLDPEAELRRALDRLAAGVATLESDAALAGKALPEWLEELPVREQHLPLC